MRSQSRMRSPLLGTDEEGEVESDLRPYSLHRCWPLATILTFVSLALLIVSAVQPALFSISFTSPLGSAIIRIGAFKLCYTAGDLSGCRDIDSACEVQALGDRLPEVKGPVVSDCDEWNAARAMLLLATVFVGLGLLCQLCATMKTWVRGTTAFAFALTVLGALCGLVAMALYAHMRNEEDGLLMDRADFSYSFTLLVIGWVLAFISAFFFWRLGG